MISFCISLIPATGFTHDKETSDKRQGEAYNFFGDFQEDLHPHFIVTSAYSSQIKEGTFSMKSSS